MLCRPSWPFVRGIAEPRPFDWHAQALAGDAPDMLPLTPQCGWYKRRLVRGGPFVPARVYLDEAGELRCEVNGADRDPQTQWRKLASAPIAKSEFDYMMARMAWAMWHKNDDPAANPRKAVDWRNLEPPRFS